MPPAATLADLGAAIPAHVLVATLAVPLLQRLLTRVGLWPYAVFALPGTLAHEFAHYAVAWALGARPRLPRLWPERVGHRWHLGSVAFVPRWWRTGPIALAPLALLPAAIGWLAAFAADADGAVLVLHVWIAGTMLGAALPSRTDLRLAAPTLALLAAFALAGWLAFRAG